MTESAVAITILSPHQDDAALSLGRFIAGRDPERFQTTILNCFTVTDYSPYREAHGITEVSKIRVGEDKLFCKQTGICNIKVVNLGEDDSLIRLNEYNLDEILRSRPLNTEDQAHIASLQAKVSRHVRGIMFVPVAIGHHIDHILTHLVGISCNIPRSRLNFYLDVPYWIRENARAVRHRIKELQDTLGYRLYPYIDQTPVAFEKRSLSSIYASQIAQGEADAIAAAPFQGEALILWEHSPVIADMHLRRVQWTDLNL